MNSTLRRETTNEVSSARGGLIFVAKLWPDATTNYLHDRVKERNETGNP